MASSTLVTSLAKPQKSSETTTDPHSCARAAAPPERTAQWGRRRGQELAAEASPPTAKGGAAPTVGAASGRKGAVACLGHGVEERERPVPDDRTAATRGPARVRGQVKARRVLVRVARRGAAPAHSGAAKPAGSIAASESTSAVGWSSAWLG